MLLDETTFERLAEDAVARYEKTVELVEQVRHEWEASGFPLLAPHPNGIDYQHPLLGLLREAEKDAAAGAKDISLPAKKLGRLPVAALSISVSPAAKKRAKLSAV